MLCLGCAFCASGGHGFGLSSGWDLANQVPKRNGRWVRRSLKTGNRRQAEAQTRKIELAEAGEGPASAPRSGSRDISWNALQKKYVPWAARHRRPNTIASTAQSIERFVEASGTERLGQVTRKHIESFKRESLARSRPRTVNVALVALKSLVNRAIKEGWYRGVNPFAGVELLPVRQAPIEWLDRDSIDRAMGAA